MDTVILLCRRCHDATDLPAGKRRLEIRVHRVAGSSAIAFFAQDTRVQARILILEEKT